MLEWMVCFSDPNALLITDMILAKQTHHCFKKGRLDAHVTTYEYTRNLLYVPSQECISASSEWLETNHITLHIRITVQESEVVLEVELVIFWCFITQQELLKLFKICFWSPLTWYNTTYFIKFISLKILLHAIWAESKLSLVHNLALVSDIKRVFVHLSVCKNAVITIEIL